MKKILLSFVLCSTVFTSASSSQLESARYLAEQDIIVKQSAQAEQYYAHSVSTTLEYQEARLYRLDDSLVRQEALGIIAKMANLYLPASYSCRGYFTDTPEWWVCRAAEVSADNGIVSRANTKFRPRDTLTFAESFGLLIKALNINLSTKPTSTVPGNLPDWQKRLILTAREQDIGYFNQINAGYSSLYYFTDDSSILSFTMSDRMTRGEFFQLAVLFLTRNQGAIPVCENYTFSNCPTGCDAVCIASSCSGNTCTADCSDAPNSCRQKPFSFEGCKTYNDGCNECTVSGGDAIACTERACIWQGIPSCSTCEVGYILNNKRCIPSPTSCVREGGVVGNYSLAPEYQNIGICCTGLTNVGSKDLVVGASNICANIGDGYCDSRYESTRNSSDCRTTTACIQEGKYAGGGYVYPPENLNDFVCCSGLTNAPHKQADQIADIGNVCIQEYDGYCDTRYESTYNSADCRTTTTFDSSVCRNYFDGCNTCSRQSNGQTICTMMACFTNGPAYCTTYNDYIPTTKAQDDALINKVYLEIQNYTKDLSCTNSSQCNWKLFGKNPCGSSSIGIKYSSKNIDMTLFESKTTFYTAIQTLYNQTYPVFGTCAVMTSPPPLSCVNNVCTPSY